MIQYTYHYLSPIGTLLMASDGEALTGLWFEGQKYYAAGLSELHEEKRLPIFDDCARWLDIYFSGSEPDFTPALAPKGSSFRRDIWALLLRIPYGETVSYGQLAKTLAAEKGLDKVSAQAVGGAVGHNPISIIVPCHRVVGAGGNLTGYAGGIDKKLSLLKLEGVKADRLYIPTKSTAP